MSTEEQHARVRPWLWASVVLSVSGIYVSGYLSYKRVAGGSLACTRWAQCDVVNNSVYAYFLGVPVAFLGLVGYGLLLVLAIAALRTSGTVQRGILAASLLASLGGVGFSIYLTYLEIYVIEALCAWCVASAVIITLCALTDAVGMWRAAPQGA